MTDIRKFIALANEELDTAELLVNAGRYRLCLSRSYYAMYSKLITQIRIAVTPIV